MTESRERPISAVVLAGGKPDPTFLSAAGVENKALAPLLGKPLVRYCLEALAGSATLGQVLVVGSEELRAPVAPGKLVAAGDTLLQNIRRGLDAAACEGPVLLLGADLPFLTPSAIDDFVSRGLACGADLCYPIVRQETIEARFPEMRRTYARLADGTFTGGNLFLLRSGFFYRCEPILAAAYDARKKPVQLARLLGLGILARFLTHRLTVAQAEARVSRVLAGTVKALETPFAEVAADVDKAEELPKAAAYLQIQAGRGS
ncbi:MAG TPA: nucleotidyltransferase family protein [Armatimonadota bacterium]|jgi:GTP:adenosylcobinamide-phosphate guanylyltransferase